MPAELETFRFGIFTLDPRRRALLAAGEPVTLHMVQFEILLLLVRGRDRPLTRDEIVAHVWRGRAVGENNLAVQVSLLRKALAAHEGGGDLIVTLPGRGYQFVGEVLPPIVEVPAGIGDTGAAAAIADDLPAPERLPLAVRLRDRRLVVVGSLAAVILLVGSWAALSWRVRESGAPRLSIAVLPFRNPGPDREQDYLATNVTDDLIADLAHIPGATVIARETAEAVRTEPPQEIGTRLRVRYVLAGTLLHEGDKYRVAAHLIDTANGAQLWSASYAAAQDSLSAAQRNIVQQIASALHVQLDQLESSRSLHDRPDNPDALDLFFRARALLDDDDSSGALSRAQAMLEEALAKEPEFADAGAQLGWLLLRKVMATDDEAEADRDWIRAKAVIDDTLRLAPRNALATSAKARRLFIEHRYREATSLAEAVLSVDASNIQAHWVLANCAWMTGQLDAEASYLQTIARLNPEGVDSKRERFLLGTVRLLQLQPAQAIALLEQSISGDPEPQPGAETLGRGEWARVWLIAAYAMNHEPEIARRKYADYADIWPNRSVWRFGAYLPRAVASMKSAKAVLDALQASGMPYVADDTVSLASPETPCGPDAYNPTPRTLQNGGKVIGTADLDRLLSETKSAVVVDVGEGTGSVPVAHWFDPSGPAETSMQFALRLAAAQRSAQSEPVIVVMGDGPFGCSAFNAANALVAKGYASVYWYRGGEEAWANSGHQIKDFRPE